MSKKTKLLIGVLKTFLLALKKAPFFTLLLIVVSVVLGFIPLISLVLIEKIQNYAFLQNDLSTATLFITIVFFGFIFFFEQVLGEIRVYLSTVVQIKLRKTLSNALIDAMMEYPTENFEKATLQETIERAASIINGGMLWEYILIIFCLPLNIISIFSVASYISNSNILVFSLLFLSLILQFVWLYVSKREEMKNSICLTDCSRKKAYYYGLFWTVSGNRDIRLFRLKDFLKNKWRKTAEELYCKTRQLHFKFLLLFIGIFALFCCTLFFSVRIETFVENPANIISVLMGFIYFMEAVANASENITTILSSENYLNVFFEIISDKSKNHFLQTEETMGIDQNTVVSMKGVGFHYPENDRMVLKNINLDVKKNEVVAIVGENGAGKTTLVKLLLGLYTPTAGNIAYSESKKNYLRNVSAEFQNFIRYEYSVFENVGLGDDLLYNDSNAIERAMHRAGFYSIADKLPNGKHQRLGKSFQEGIELSGGQWQKLGLARACLRDSLVISLDEPTASLDPKAEAEVLDLFLDNHHNNTVILVAHRIGPARMADRIIVLHEGEIAEEGTHDELVALRGKYYELYMAQSKWYGDKKDIV